MPRNSHIGSVRVGWVLISVISIFIAGIVSWNQPPDPRPDRLASDKSTLELLLYPIEINPGLGLPSAPAGFNSTWLADDGLHGIVVGYGGTILATSDSGQTWIAQDSGVDNALLSVFCNFDCKTSWIVGRGGTILMTNDGGAVWKKVTNIVAGATRLQSVYFEKNLQRGWVAGDLGTMLYTIDAGKTWLRKQVGESDNLIAVCFGDEGTRGWTVGFGGVVYSTKDAGQNWNRRYGAYNTLVDVWCEPGGTKAWAVGYNNKAFRMSEGSASLIEAGVPELSSNEKIWLDSIHFEPSGIQGWILRRDGNILKTVDGGITWQVSSRASNIGMSSIHFDIEGKRGVAAGAGGTIASSSDGGVSWETQVSSKNSLLTDIHFHENGKMGWAVGSSGIILATQDGGVTWSSQTSGTSQSLNEIGFSQNGEVGIAIGNFGVIISTRDGGKNWITQQSGVEESLNSVYINSTGLLAWAVGETGVVLKSNNGGKDWLEIKHIDKGHDLSAVYFDQEGQNGWVFGTEGAYGTSSDGGLTWDTTQNYTDRNIYDVWFDDRGNYGRAVGASGLLITTNNGGESWLEHENNLGADLRSVRFSSDGQLGFAAGDAGTIIKTTNGGDTWTRADSKVGSSRLGLAYQEGGKSVWAVGYPPALLKSIDNGTDWEPLTWPLVTTRYPAPWFWLIVLLAISILIRAVRVESESVEMGIEAIAISDAPISRFAQDRLQFGALARGISRFFRNTNTRPPLTIAISGDWGSGKSTLMKLICSDLRRYGTRPIWFNAWHHQREEQMLTALLNGIRTQSLPPIGSLDGLAFRLKLLLTRSKKHFFVMVLVLAVASIAVGFLISHDYSEWFKLLETLRNFNPRNLENENRNKIVVTGEDFFILITQILAVVTTVLSLFKGMKAFKIDPTLFLSSAAENMKIKNVSAKLSFRSKFSEQFKEVTDALPYTMVIVIDDLDRCQPETVLTVMEAVNFLVSSGRCIVLFGMDTNKVEVALGLVFEKVATELANVSEKSRDFNEKRNNKSELTSHRLAYARRYLEKLVNIEIKVPSGNNISSGLLVDDIGSSNSNTVDNTIGKFLEYWPLWLVLVVTIIGIYVGAIQSPTAEPQVNVIVRESIESEEENKSIAENVAGQTPTARKVIEDMNSQGTTQYVPALQRNFPVITNRWVIGATWLFIVTIVAVFALFQLRKSMYRVRDSQSFRDALKMWMPVIEHSCDTPRAVKRFGNRLRYLSMLQHDNELEKSGFDVFRSWLNPPALSTRRQFRTTSVGSPKKKGNEKMLDENLIVALASFHQFYGEEWINKLRSVEISKPDDLIMSAIKKHTQNLDMNWPPSERDISIFEKMLSGIRVSA